MVKKEQGIRKEERKVNTRHDDKLTGGKLGREDRGRTKRIKRRRRRKRRKKTKHNNMEKEH